MTICTGGCTGGGTPPCRAARQGREKIAGVIPPAHLARGLKLAPASGPGCHTLAYVIHCGWHRAPSPTPAIIHSGRILEPQPVQPTIERRARHTELPGRVRDIAASLDDETMGINEQRIVERIGPSDPAAASAGGFKAANGIFGYKVSLELRHGGEDMKDELAAGGARVDTFGKGAKMNAIVFKAFEEIGQVMHGAPKPVEFIDDERITGFEGVYCLAQSRALAHRAGNAMIGEYVLASCAFQGVELHIEALIRG